MSMIINCDTLRGLMCHPFQTLQCLSHFFLFFFLWWVRRHGPYWMVQWANPNTNTYLKLSFVSFPPPISWLSISPCLIHERHACSSQHVPEPCCATLKGAWNTAALHTATSSQLFPPITLNSRKGPQSDTRLADGCDRRVLQRGATGRSNSLCMFKAEREVIGGWFDDGTQQIKASPRIWQCCITQIQG